MSTYLIKNFLLSPLPRLKLISVNLTFLRLLVCTQRCDRNKGKVAKRVRVRIITTGTISHDCNLIVSQHNHLLIFYLF